MKVKYLFILFGIVLMMNLVSASVWNSTYESGLLSYWSLNSNANDNYGNKNLGEINSPLHYNSSCKNGGCYNFTGISYLTNLSAFTGAVNYPRNNTNSSINLWWKTSNPSSVPPQIAFSYGAYALRNNMMIFDQNLNIIGGGTIGGSGTGAGALDDNWHQLTLVHFDNDSTKLYYDGLDSMTVNSNFNLSNGGIYIGGGDVSGVGDNFNGSIDEVSVYNRTLKPNEITDLYNGGNGIFFTNFSYWKENLQTFNNITYSGNLETFSIDLSYDNSYYSAINVIFNYNNTNYTTNISGSAGNQVFSSTITIPTVTTQTNKTFYYIIGLTNSTATYYYNSTSNNQTIDTIALTTTCGGNFNFLNITNFDEESLNPINGTVEYTLNLQSNNNILSSINGTSTGTNISFCSNINLINSYVNYNLQLRYYSNGYFYKTYNIQNSAISNLPILIPLYYLNNSIGTSFKINYVDFNYLTYPNAIIQIQRQYLPTNSYNTVEIPKMDNNGQAIGSFNTNNIRYKLIVINNGVILDTFNDIFPSCQNVVLGTCELNLRGIQSTTSSTTGDFTYTLVKTNTSLTLTYIIPSGTPRTIEFLTNQNSRFLNNISTCDTTLFSSGGTITCTYNNTVGDSIISTQIINSDGTTLYGSVGISEDLSSFFLLNNYFIGFVLILLLALIFISSGAILVIVGIVGLVYLSLIFLLKGMDIYTLGGSIGWLIVAGILIIYKISKREDTT